MGAVAVACLLLTACWGARADGVGYRATLRAGAAYETMGHGDDSGSYSQTGAAPFVDVGAAVDYSRFAIGAFVAYAAMHDAGSGQLEDASLTYDAHDRFTDIGVRVQLRADAMRFELAVGGEDVHESGSYTRQNALEMPYLTSATGQHAFGGVFVQLGAGYALPRLASCRCAFEVVGAVQAAGGNRDPSSASSAADLASSVVSARIGLGVAWF